MNLYRIDRESLHQSKEAFWQPNARRAESAAAGNLGERWTFAIAAADPESGWELLAAAANGCHEGKERKTREGDFRPGFE